MEIKKRFSFLLRKIIIWTCWDISSDGRAPRSQRGGRRFDPVMFHQINFQPIAKRIRNSIPFRNRFFDGFRTHIFGNWLSSVLELEKCKNQTISGWKNAKASQFSVGKMQFFNYRNNEKFLVINSLSPTIPTLYFRTIKPSETLFQMKYLI